MPEYGILGASEGGGLLAWAWARRRLERARRYWFASTRPDGRPHAVAVWGVWLDDVFYFSTGRHSRKTRNLARNPSVVVSTERADKAVIVEGVARRVRDPKRLARVARVYAAKYGETYPGDSNVYAVRPVTVFGFIETEPDFSGRATRWQFQEERPR